MSGIVALYVFLQMAPEECTAMDAFQCSIVLQWTHRLVATSFSVWLCAGAATACLLVVDGVAVGVRKAVRWGAEGQNG